MKATLKLLHDRCEAYGECLLWQQGTNGSGVPQISLSAAQRSQSVRRLAYTLMHGSIPAGKFVTPCCGNSLCIARGCLKALTKSEYMALASARGAYRTPELCALRARVAQRDSKLAGGMQAAQKIRRDRQAGVLLRVIAEEHGISVDTASRISRGLLWKEAHPSASVFEWARAA